MPVKLRGPESSENQGGTPYSCHGKGTEWLALRLSALVHRPIRLAEKVRQAYVLAGSPCDGVAPMALYLSATELSQLQAALQILLSPLAFESIGAWRLDARQRVAALLHADTAISFLPLKAEAPFLSNREVAITQYLEHYHRFDHISDYRPTQAFALGSLQSRWDRDRREARRCPRCGCTGSGRGCT